MPLTFTKGSNLPTIEQWINELKETYTVLDVIDCDLYENNLFELYNQLKKNYKTTYQEHHRIVLTITKDFYKELQSNTVLQSVQTMLNELDISNFFTIIISTNPNLEEEYLCVHKNTSVDPVLINLYKASGDYTNTYKDISIYQTFSGLGNNSVLLENLPDRARHLFLESKTFCVLPWISQYVTQDNKVNPCCYISTDTALGNANNETLEDIWNNKNTRQLRLDMLEGKELEACKTCYLKDQKYKGDTARTAYNRDFIQEFPSVLSTNNDGSLEKFKIKLLNYKPNNLCNLQCRMCQTKFSSSLYSVEKLLGMTVPDKAFVASNPDLLEQYFKHIDHLNQIIFEGGEPLMMKETYDFVEKLDEKKRHDIKLMYITNMTYSGLGSRDIFKLWQNFKNIIVFASLDAEYDRALYLRPGSYTWDKIVDFTKQIKQKRPDIFFNVQSTITILNALHMPDFHRNWVEQGLIDADQWIVNLLTNKQYLRVTTAPEYLKDLIREKFQKHVEWLRPLDPYGKSTTGYMAIIHAMDNNETFNPKLFWKEIEQRDKIYNVKLLDVFPELVDLPR